MKCGDDIRTLHDPVTQTHLEHIPFFRYISRTLFVESAFCFISPTAMPLSQPFFFRFISFRTSDGQFLYHRSATTQASEKGGRAPHFFSKGA